MEKDLAICEAATKGKWLNAHCDLGLVLAMDEEKVTTICKLDDMDDRPDDFEFIAEARDALPWYINRAMELEAQRSEDIALMEETVEAQRLAKATIEKLQAEIDRLTALNAYTVDELNKAEAHTAVMVQALERCRATYSHITATDNNYDLTDGINRIDATLSSGAGKELLDKVRKLEAVVDAVKLVLTRKDGLEHYFAELDDALNALDGDKRVLHRQ